MKFYNFIFSLSFVLLICSCNNSEPVKIVESFYKNQIQIYDFRKADKAYLSPEIQKLIQDAILKENQSANELKSIGSTDKPDMIEGDVFTSNYEGAQSFQTISSEQNQNEVKVKVEFSYQNNKWIDEVFLKLENNKWLITDIKYGQNYLQGSLLKSLDQFVNESAKIVGGDKDSHGCIGSAGYTWSDLKQTCIRSFELPFQLLNPEGTMSAGLHFSNDLSKAELFLPDGKISLTKIEADKYKYLVDRKTVGVLNKNNGKWEFFIVGSNAVYKQK